MVYIFALVGFVIGFGVGLGVINVLLRHYTKKQLKTDSSLRWRYGLAVWVFAGLGGWLGIWLHNNSLL
jgi:undecaprenyl pyrophosphate phosphatase UppP